MLDAVQETFGPERLIYASNWPVSERFGPLAAVQASSRRKELSRLIWMNPHHGNDLFCGGGRVGPVMKGDPGGIGDGFPIINVKAGNHADKLFLPPPAWRQWLK